MAEKFTRRVITENSETLINERDIMTRFLQATEKQDELFFVKAKMRESAEGSLVSKLDNEVKALIEIKCRRVAYKTTGFKTIVLSWFKYSNMCKLVGCTKDEIPMYFIVAFTDGIYCTELKPNQYTPQYFENSSSEDRESCIHIPLEKFEYVCPGREGGYFK